MFWPFLVIAATVLAGGVVLGRLTLPSHWLVRLSYGVVLGTVLVTAVGLAISYLVGFSVGWRLAVVGLAVAGLFFRSWRSFLDEKRFGKNIGLPILLVTLLLGVILYRLYDTHILWPDRQGNLFTGESTYGDLPFHLGIISQFVYGEKTPPENPFFSGRGLAYPYFIDFYTAILVKAGLSIREAIVGTGMVLGLSLVFIFYDFVYFVSRSKSVAVLAVILFFFHGGLGFYYFLKGTGPGFQTILALFQPWNLQEYSHLFSENIQWANFLSRMIVPERSLLLGIPAGLMILRLLLAVEGKYRVGWGLVLSAALFGALPLVHSHTFLVMGIVIFVLALKEFQRSNLRPWLTKWLFFAVVAGIVTIPGLYSIYVHLKGSDSFFRFRLWWESGSEGPLLFWWKNLGLFLPLVAAFFTLRKTPIMVKVFAGLSIFIFFLVNLFQFQPYRWDNVKLLIWFAVFGSVPVSFILVKTWSSKSRTLRVLVVFAFVVLTASAILSVWRESFVKYQLFSAEEVQLADWVTKFTPAGSVFLTAPIHNSFVNNLAGRKVFLGYPGMLWVHGISPTEREKAVKLIYTLPGKSLGIIKESGIDYLVVGPYERGSFAVNRKEFDRLFCLVESTPGYRIYKSRPCGVLF